MAYTAYATKKPYTAKKQLEGPASVAQISYIDGLLKKKQDPSGIGMKWAVLKMTGAIKESGGSWTTSGTLSKQQASDWITALIAAPKQVVASVTFDAAPPVVGPLSAPAPKIAGDWSFQDSPQQVAVPEEGYYEIAEGHYAGIYAFLTKTKKGTFGGKVSTKVLMKLSIKTMYDGTKKGSWAKYGYVTTAKKVLAGQSPMTKADAMAFGKKYTFCIRCGAFLSDPVSVASGIGPVCAGYWS